jgi:hypothetical protein
MRSKYKILAGKAEEKVSLGKHDGENNIKTDLKKIVWIM